MFFPLEKIEPGIYMYNYQLELQSWEYSQKELRDFLSLGSFCVQHYMYTCIVHDILCF